MENKDAYRFSGDAAKNYDQYLGPILFEPYALDTAARIPATAKSILEIASGTGRVTRQIRNRFPKPTNITASDLNNDMLEVARKELGDNSIQYVVANAQELPFKSESFDAIVCQFGFMFLEDKQKGFNEAFRVLKPGGKLIFATWERTENVPLFKVIYNDNILQFVGHNEAARFVVPFSLHNPDELRTWLTKAGFRDLKVTKVELQGKATRPDDIAEAFVLKHSMGKEIGDKDPEAVPVIAERIRKDVEEKFGKHPVFQLAAWIGEALR